MQVLKFNPHAIESCKMISEVMSYFVATIIAFMIGMDVLCVIRFLSGIFLCI